MSVLKTNRTESKAEYINIANEIYLKTIDFLSRMSARYSRLMAEKTANLASDLFIEAEKGNSIYPSDSERIKMREKHFLEARASLMALDVQLSNCFSVMLLNPQGCFTQSDGSTLTAKKAKKRLSNLAQSIGELIDKENNLLTALMKSDKKRKINEEENIIEKE